MTVARVLVMEDEGNVRYVTVAALRLGGYDVSEVATGRNALDAVAAQVANDGTTQLYDGTTQLDDAARRRSRRDAAPARVSVVEPE